MTGRGDRGVAPVIGFILIFSFLVIAFTLYQGIVVPDQNKKVEFNHNEMVQDRMEEVRNSIVSAATTGASRSVAIPLGADYPDRTLARNLGFSGGMLRTRNASDTGGGILIKNVTATDAETKDYFGSAGDTTLGPFPNGTALKMLTYEPIYSFYSQAPVTNYENTLVYNRFDRTNLTITDQLIIDGSRITLVALVGDVDKSGTGTVSVDPEAVSAPGQRLTIKNKGGRLNLTIPTRLDVSVWNETLSDETDRLVNVSKLSSDRIAIHLENGTYQLGLALVKVGNGIQDVPAHYLTDIEGDDTSVPEGGTQKLVVEVRDRYNNPKENVTVTANITGPNEIGTFEKTGSRLANETTDVTGRVTFVYNASNVDSNTNVNVTVSILDNSSARERVTFNLRVLEMDAGGGGGGPGAGTPFQFLSIVRGPPGTVASGSTHLITVEVRNETHVPVKGVDVRAIAANISGATHNGTFRSGEAPNPNRTIKTTDADGQVTFNYTAPATLSAKLRMRFQIVGGSLGRGNVSLRVNVSGTGGTGGGGDGTGGNINPGQSGDIRLVDALIKNARVELKLNNTGSKTKIANARYQFYSIDSQGGGGGATPSPPKSLNINGGPYLNLRGSFVSLSGLELPSNTDTRFCLTFYQEENGGGGQYTNVEEGDFFVITFTFSNGQSATYFVAPGSGSGSCHTGSSTVFPSAFNDGTSPEPESSEDESIPPGTQERGNVSDFSNMQTSDGSYATLIEGWDGSQYLMDIGTVSQNIYTGGSEYELTVDYAYQNINTGSVDIVIVDSSNNELQRETLSVNNANRNTLTVTLNSAAETFVQNNGKLFVRYEQGGDTTVTQLRVYSQKVEVVN